MGEKDITVSKIKISHEGRFDLLELYRYLKSLLKENGYDILEKKYEQKEKEDSKSKEIEFGCEKKINDYITFQMEIKIKGKGLKNVSVKKRVIQKGKVGVEFKSYLELDVDDKFEKNMIWKFLRTLKHRFVVGDQLERLHSELKEETYEIFNKIKAYLRMEQAK